QWLEGISGRIGGLRQMLTAIPNMKTEDLANLNRAVDMVTNLVKTSGVEDVSGVGVSSIAVEKSFYHSKALVHHYKGKGSGFIWSMFGQKVHPLNGLDFLPANTAV